MNRPFIFGMLVTTVALSLTLIWALGTDEGRVRPALAGPCAADPELVFESDPDNPLDFVFLFGSAGKLYEADFSVETLPEQLPPGKPPVTIDVVDAPGHPGIHFDFDPSSSDGSFNTELQVEIDSDVPPGAYDFEIVMVCHEQEAVVDFTVFVDTCPLFAAGFAPSGNGTPTPQPFPSACAAPSPTPGGSATPTPSLTPTATPTPTGSGQPALKQGDVDCNNSVTSVDALKQLRHVALLSVQQNEPCPDIETDVASKFGDVDCNGAVTSVDALKVLRFVALLSVTQTEPCPDIGDPLG